MVCGEAACQWRRSPPSATTAGGLQGLQALSPRRWPPLGAFIKLPALRVVHDWEGIFDESHTLSSARVQALGTTNASVALTQSAEVLVLGGAITPTVNVASFEYAYRLPQGIISASKMEKLQSSLRSVNGSAAAYVLELVDINGAVLFSQPFDSTGSFEGDSRQVFFLTVP